MHERLFMNWRAHPRPLLRVIHDETFITGSPQVHTLSHNIQGGTMAWVRQPLGYAGPWPGPPATKTRWTLGQ